MNPSQYSWLLGPFGELNGIGESFIYQLAEKENLTVCRNTQSTGLLETIENLNLSERDIKVLSNKVIDFYEKSSDYDLKLRVRWKSIFKLFGYIVNRLFSQRINQLNVPMHNIDDSEDISSEIIRLVDNSSNQLKYTIWLRKIRSTGQVIYSGIYTTCTLPTGTTCIKAIFPLPMGNATVLLQPTVGDNDELVLDASGNNFGEAGFYFLLEDANGNLWGQYIKTFKDQLIVSEEITSLKAMQTLRL